MVWKWKIRCLPMCGKQRIFYMVLKAIKSVVVFSYQFYFLDREAMEKTLCFPSVPRPRFGLLRKNPTENFLHLWIKFSLHWKFYTIGNKIFSIKYYDNFWFSAWFRHFLPKFHKMIPHIFAKQKKNRMKNSAKKTVASRAWETTVFCMAKISRSVHASPSFSFNASYYSCH